jgi:hypothetical protein
MKYKLSILICFILCLNSCQENDSSALVIHYYQLDESLKKSNDIIHYATRNIIETMAETCKTKVQYQPLVNKASKATEKADSLIAFIDQLKVKMLKETGGIYTKEEAIAAQDTLLEGLPKGAKNTSIADQILLKGTYDYQNNFPKAVLLDQKLQELSKQYIVLLESCWEKKPIQGSLFSDLRKKEKTIQQVKEQFTLNTSQHSILTQNKKQTWAENNFKNKPLMLVLNILTAIQNDIRTTQYALVDFFGNQVVPFDYNSIYDKFEILAHSPQSSIRLGETYNAEIALGAYSSKSVFDVVINQDTIHSMGGKAIYRVRPRKVGTQEYEAEIKIENPLTGETETFRRTFSFHVIP